MGTSLNAAARGTGPGYPALCSRSYPGRPDQVPQVRALLARVLDGCPAIEDAVLMADELAANAVLHSHSGDPGGEFTVRVEVRDGEWVRVEVTDEGGPTPPGGTVRRATGLHVARHTTRGPATGTQGGAWPGSRQCAAAVRNPCDPQPRSSDHQQPIAPPARPVGTADE